MPELPEVETVVKSISKNLIGKSFSSISLMYPRALDNFNVKDFNRNVKGEIIKKIFRRAKYIIIATGHSIIAIHLRMTGKLYICKIKDIPNKKHLSVILYLDNEICLIFEDTRRFGRFYLFNNMDYLNRKLGIEPINNKEFTESWLLNNILTYNRQIKALLFDQSFICGLGNIYIDEALWYAGIHPLSKSSMIPSYKIKKLHKGIIQILRNSIKAGGTTIRDYTYDYSYVGNYKINLNVFGRDNEKCNRCKSIIIKIKVMQRGTHLCPRCQIMPND